MNLYNIGMAKRCNKACFALKTCGGIRISLQVGIELFDGNKTTQPHIKRLPNLSLPTTGQTFPQFIFIEASQLSTHIYSYCYVLSERHSPYEYERLTYKLFGS